MNQYIQQAQVEARHLVAGKKNAFCKIRDLARVALYVEGYQNLRILAKERGQYIATVDVAYGPHRRVFVGRSVKQATEWFVRYRSDVLLNESIANAG